VRFDAHGAMKRSIVLIAFFVACSAASAAAPVEASARRFPHLPEDAQQVAERLEDCLHFSGEFGGDGSARDKEVNLAMTELDCNHVSGDVIAIQKKYAANKAVMKVFNSLPEF